MKRKGRAVFVFEVSWPRDGGLKYGPAPALLMAAIESGLASMGYPGVKCTRWAVPELRDSGSPKRRPQVAVVCPDGHRGTADRGTRWPVRCDEEGCGMEAAPRTWMRVTGRLRR